jgi:hypothetical protein
METTIEDRGATQTQEAMHAIEEAKVKLRQFGESAKSFIQAHPAASLFAAVALGYVVARIARRWS